MTPKSTQRTGKRYSERKMPKVVPKFKDTLKFTFTHEQLDAVSWSWKDQIKQFWEDWIPKDKDLSVSEPIYLFKTASISSTNNQEEEDGIALIDPNTAGATNIFTGASSELIIDSKNRDFASASDWVLYDPDEGEPTFGDDGSPAYLEITGTDGAEKEGAELPVAEFATLIAGNT